MIRAARVKWIPNEYPIITLFVNGWDWEDVYWDRHMDNYTCMIGPLIHSWFRRKEPQLHIDLEKTFKLTDGTVEILSNPVVGFPYLDKYPQEIAPIQFTTDAQCMRDSIGNPCYIKAYTLNAYLKENNYDWRVGLVKPVNSDRARVEAVRYCPGVFDGPQCQEYSEPHEVVKVFGEWNDTNKL